MSVNSGSKVLAASHPWIWALPVAFFFAMAVIFFSDSNLDLFFVINTFSQHTGDLFWALLTIFSDGLVSFVILLPWIRKRPQIIWAVLLATILSTLFSQVLKRMVNAARPPQVLSPEAFHLIGPDWGQYSFPSGHASMIFILAGAFSLITKKVWLRCVLIFGASLIALSRVVVGVHWPLDVLAGAAIGWIAVWLSLSLSPRTRWGWGSLAQKILGALLLVSCVILFSFDYTGYENTLFVQRFLAVIFFCVGLYEYLKIYGIHLFARVRP